MMPSCLIARTALASDGDGLPYLSRLSRHRGTAAMAFPVGTLGPGGSLGGIPPAAMLPFGLAASGADIAAASFRNASTLLVEIPIYGLMNGRARRSGRLHNSHGRAGGRPTLRSSRRA